jgi:SAM-dependent methyltransferase
MTYCPDCGHGQLSHGVSPEALYTDYAYASGTSTTLRAYFSWFADECADLVPAGSTVLEIACNDGSLLRELDDRGLYTFGIDPARNLTSARSGLRIKTAMWPCELPVGPYPNYDLIIGMNVLAHGPDPLGFLQAVRKVLAPGGLCLIQVSQAHQLERGEIDTIYHEHFSYFTVSSMLRLASRADLACCLIREVSVHGGSLVFGFSRLCFEDTAIPNRFLVNGPFSVHSKIPRLGSDDHYAAFAEKTKLTLNKVAGIMAQKRLEGWHVAFVGAAAKAIVFMNALGILPDNVYDEAPLKIGKWIPGHLEPILDLKEIEDVDGPVLAIVGAWNYREELEGKVKKVREGKVTEFMVYYPTVEVWA